MLRGVAQHDSKLATIAGGPGVVGPAGPWPRYGVPVLILHDGPSDSPCAGYLAHPFSKDAVFTLEFRRCDPSFPACLPGSRSLQEGHGCLDHDGFSICSPGAIRLVSRCDWPTPALLLCASEAVFRS
jgi:hypothetical protein